ANHPTLLKPKNLCVLGSNSVGLSPLVVRLGVRRVRSDSNNRTNPGEVSVNLDVSLQLSGIHAHLLHSEESEEPASAHHVSSEHACARSGEMIPRSRVFDEYCHIRQLR